MPARYKALAAFVAGTGLRQGEAFGVQARDIDWLRHTLTVQRQVQPSGVGPLKNKAAYRVIPLGQVVIEALAAHLSHSQSRCAYVSTDEQGKPLDRTRFNRSVWQVAINAAGLPGVGMHTLRHAYASLLIAAWPDGAPRVRR